MCFGEGYEYGERNDVLVGRTGANTFTVKRIQVWQMIETEEQRRIREERERIEQEERLNKEKSSLEKKTNEKKTNPNEMKDEIYRQSIPLTSQWLYHVTHFFGTFNGIWDDIRQFSRTRPDSFSIAFLLQGTMHESQRLMVAIPAAFFLFIDAFKQQLPRKQCFMRLIALILIALALIMTCKRGPLLTAFILMLPIAFCYFKRGTILTIALLVAIVFLVPASRTRVLAIPDEFSAEKGGRYAMWTQIVPNIHEDYPLGIGFRTLTSEKMRYYCPNMEKRPHSHVHSTPLQVFVEFSWIGIIAYSLWVLLTIIPSIVYWRRGAGLYAIIPLAMACSLLLFGLVEYNLADGEIVLLYVS